jgi:hypothetical protein
MIAFVEERSSGERWLVVLNERGDLIHTRRMQCAAEPQGFLGPIISKEQYDADRQKLPKPAKLKIGEQFGENGAEARLSSSPLQSSAGPGGARHGSDELDVGRNNAPLPFSKARAKRRSH